MFGWITFVICAVFQVRNHRATRPNLGTSTAQRHVGWNDRHAAQKGRKQLYMKPEVSFLLQVFKALVELS